MYFETLFGFTSGLDPAPFYNDVIHDWMMPRVSFDSPGLLYQMREGFRALLNPTPFEETRLERFMASGTSRGTKVMNLVGGREVKLTPSKTLIIIASGNILYYANLRPLNYQHYLVGIPKFEQTKVRGIVTTPNYLHFGLMRATKWLEHNMNGAFNYMKKQDRRNALSKLLLSPVCALDQSGFDHNLSLLQLTTLLEIVPYSEYALDMLSEPTTSVQAGPLSVIMRNGMSSGYAYTSILDSAVNLAQLSAISRVSGVVLSNTIVQGDDVATNIKTELEARKVISVSNALGGKMNAKKILFRQDGSVDFLRTMYETRDKIAYKFMARCIASMVYFKPWTSSTEEGSTLDVLSGWLMLYSRGATDKDNYVLRELNSTSLTPKLPIDLIRRWIDRPHAIKIIINQEDALAMNLAMLRPMSEQAVKQLIEYVKSLTLTNFGVPDGLIELGVMIPGLTAIQKRVMRQLNLMERQNLSWLLSDYVTPFYYEDQTPKKIKETWLIIDFSRSAEGYTEQTDALKRYALTQRANRRSKILEDNIVNVKYDDFFEQWIIQL